MRYQEIIMEEIVGKFAKVYHRTHTHENVQAIRDDGFKSGPRAMSGAGIYTTYSLISQFTPYHVEQYGDYIIKSRIKLEGFLILDSKVAKSVYGNKWRLVDQAKWFNYTGWDDQLERFQDDINAGELSSHIAHEIANRKLMTRMRGIVYSGARDGQCAVCYETDTILPIAWTKVGLDEIASLRSQPKVGAAERAFAASLAWENIVSRKLVAKSMSPSMERDLVTKPELIKQIPDPTPDQQMTAVRADPDLIRYIKNPAPEVQAEATEKKPDVVKYIRNPTPGAIIYPLLVTLDNRELLARLDPGTVLAALRMTCSILPAVVRGNADREPTPEQWAAAWEADDSEEMISMFIRDDRKHFDASTIPQGALARMLTKTPNFLRYFKDPSPEIVATALLSPANSFGNALAQCALNGNVVDCSAVPEDKMIDIVEQQPHVIYAIKDVPTELVAVAMRKDRALAQELDRNYDLPAELKALVPKGVIFR